uniref:Uncharacterized protein MANES_03G127000 n=1 Tax=Rhizophora mucronata TaxID=61149 RepID=A0A2P2LK76_RHIMU
MSTSTTPCTIHLGFACRTLNSPSCMPKLASQFLGVRSKVRPLRIGPSNGSRATCWFKFGKNGVDADGAGIYGRQTRDDFDRDDVEQVLSLSLSTNFLEVELDPNYY